MEKISTLPENTSRRDELVISGARFQEEEEGVKVEDADRYLSGNRWPRQETLALLKIRSDMDLAFRDSGIRAHLWEDVSRKLRELGYNRSAKKCKEKFENIYKYHKRTKEGRSGRPYGKNYRFFEQLEALDNKSGLFSYTSPDKVHSSVAAATVTPGGFIQDAIPCSFRSPSPSPSMNFVDATSTSTASTSSEESEGTKRKKRKLTVFFERLMKEVIDRQESMQRNLMEAIERCERERMARDEAWKMQELDRIKKERELLVQERSIAAAKDAAVLSFLEKFSEQGGSVEVPANQIVPWTSVETQVQKVAKKNDTSSMEIFGNLSSSRWPKEEIDALIRLRANLDFQYKDNGPKGHLWEEVSASMKNLGYDRNAKRCKEKWENMNKYFKRVKESNKKRAGDSKTCPYFQQLDAIYREKSRKIDSGLDLKPEELLMHMMGGQGVQQEQASATTEGESENVDHSQDGDGEKEDGNGCRVVVNNPSSMAMME